MTYAEFMQRRFVIEVLDGGLVAVRDTTTTASLGEGVYSVDTREEADAILAEYCTRSVDGDGWILRRYWEGSWRDIGELSQQLMRAHESRQASAAGTARGVL